MTEHPLSASIAHLFHELRESITFILGIHQALDQRLPGTAQELWNNLGGISEQLLIEIEDQMGIILANIDSYSPDVVTARIYELANDWEKKAEKISLIADQISSLQVHLKDSNLNKILSEYMQSSVRGFGRIVSFAKQIRPEDLSLD